MSTRAGLTIVVMASVSMAAVRGTIALAQAPHPQPPARGAAVGPASQVQPGVVPQAAINGQRQAPPVAPPFVLTAEQDAELNQLLRSWENQSNKIKTFDCTFTRWEYNPAYANGKADQVTTESKGELKYAAPDKGLFRVTEMSNYVLDQQQLKIDPQTKRPDPATMKYVPQKSDQGEYWTCDGDSIFEVDHKEKVVNERRIPNEMKGKAITDGPLPFVFGAKAEELKRRFYLRVITPPQRADVEIWLEARPKLQKDAANYSRVEIILTRKEFLPVALQIFDPGFGPGNQSRTAIMLAKPAVNNWLTQFKLFLNNFARPNPFGYQHVVVPPEMPAPAGNRPLAGSGPPVPAPQGGPNQARNPTNGKSQK